MNPMNEILKNNPKMLDRINPELIKWLKKEQAVDWIQKIKSKNGDDNFIVKYGSKNHLAYSMQNPTKEAKKAVKRMNLYKEDISILMGIGLGYLANEMLSKMEKGHRIIAIEPVADILRMALGKFDFTKYFKNGTFLLVTPGGDDIKNKLTFALHHISNQSVVSAWPFTVENYVRKRPDEYDELTRLTSDILNQILCNTGTIAGAAGGIIADNDIACLPYVIRHRGVTELKGLYKNKPAILVSTGPSLKKNIHHLIDLKDRAIIIAVGQALRVLLAYGIRPDFICTVDFGEVNMGHFKGLMDADVPLVTINRAYAPLLKAWQGPKFIAATPVPGFEEMAAGILTDKGFIEAGGSVAHLCFGLAQLLECNPIAFIGQDLSLDKTSHIDLADAGGEILIGEDGMIRWKVKDQRCSLHGDQLHGMGPVYHVPGYYGKHVITNAGLASFLTVFESMVKRCREENKKRIVINATEGGAKIDGTIQLSLKKTIEKYCKDPIDKSRIQSLLSYADDAEELIDRVIPLLKNDIDTLNDIITNSRKGIAVSHGIKKLMQDKKYSGLLTKKKTKLFDKLNKEVIQEAEGNALIVNQLFFKKAVNALKKSRLKTIMIMSDKNFRFSEAAHIAAIKNPLVNVAIYGASRQIQKRDLKVDATINNFLKNKQDAIIRTERNIIILNAAKTAAKSLKKTYKETLKLLKKYQKTKDDSLLKPPIEEEINLDDADKYFESGNWAHPLLDAEKILKYVELAENKMTAEQLKAQEIYIKAVEMRENTIKEAIKAEEKNHDKMVKLIKYNDLIKAAKDAGHLEKNFHKALKFMKKAIKLMPDEEEARWGYATALHHAGEIQKAAKEYKKLVKDFPENNTFQFEYGQVLLQAGEMQKGMKEIAKVMDKTDEFDNFLFRIGEIYQETKMFSEAIIAYSEYLKKFPFDFNAMLKKAECLKAIGKITQAENLYKKAMEIKGD